MEIEWTDEDPVTGDKRFVQAERFARQWRFRVRSRRRTNWEPAPRVTREMWETLLDALDRRSSRREGVTEEDLKQVRAAVASLPPAEEERGFTAEDAEDAEKKRSSD